jgi:hypothetical protein
MPPPELPTRLLLDSADPAKTENDIEGRELVVAARSVMLTQSVRRADPT